MVKPHPIDVIIKKINPADHKKMYASWNLIAFDPATRTVVKQNWLLNVFKRDLLYFAIKNQIGFAGKATNAGFEVRINDFENQQELLFIVGYEASCPLGKEGKLLAAIEKYDELGREVEQMIIKWVQEETLAYIKAHPHDDFLPRLNNIKNQVTIRASYEAGLELTVTLTPTTTTPLLESQTITHPKLEIILKNFTKPQALSIKLHLQLDNNKRGLAMIHGHQQLQLSEWSATAINRFLAAGTLEAKQFFQWILEGSLGEKIKEQLQNEMQKRGQSLLKVEATLIEPAPVMQFVDNLEEIITVHIIEFPNPVELRNQAHARLQDYVTYKMAGTPNLHEWFKTKITQAIKQVLFQKKYEDVLANFLPIKEQIRNMIQKEATLIGYSIDPLITKTNLGPEKLLEEFILEETKVEFKTRCSDAVVHFGLHVTGRLENLNKVSNLLRNPSVSCEEIMKAKSLAKLKAILLGMDPERVYTRFDYTEIEGETPVEATLINLLEQLLKTTYNATNLEIKILTQPSPITDKLNSLLKKSSTFQCNLQPNSCDYHYPITADFRVHGVNEKGWQRFFQMEFGMMEIADELIKFYQARFSQFNEHQLLAGMQYQQKFEQLFNDLGHQQIIKLFGLEISVYNVIKGRSSSELLNVQWEQDKRKVLFGEKAKDLQLKVEMADKRREKYKEDILQRQNFDLSLKKTLGKQLIDNLHTDSNLLNDPTSIQILELFQQPGDAPNSQSLSEVIDFASSITEEIEKQTHSTPAIKPPPYQKNKIFPWPKQYDNLTEEWADDVFQKNKNNTQE